MRISDGSSDVCSSDLRRAHTIAQMHVSDAQEEEDGRGVGRADDGAEQKRFEPGQAEEVVRHRTDGARRKHAADRRQPDRKSAVTGKSVSVRGDLGGRRIINTKKTKT